MAAELWAVMEKLPVKKDPKRLRGTGKTIP
jgi:hypothetical protein